MQTLGEVQEHFLAAVSETFAYWEVGLPVLYRSPEGVARLQLDSYRQKWTRLGVQFIRLETGEPLYYVRMADLVHIAGDTPISLGDDPTRKRLGFEVITTERQANSSSNYRPQIADISLDECGLLVETLDGATNKWFSLSAFLYEVINFEDFWCTVESAGVNRYNNLATLAANADIPRTINMRAHYNANFERTRLDIAFAQNAQGLPVTYQILGRSVAGTEIELLLSQR